jgi:hypothetical protein
MVNLTGQEKLDESIRSIKALSGTFITFTEPWWERTNQPGYSKFQADELFRHAAERTDSKSSRRWASICVRNLEGPLVKLTIHVSMPCGNVRIALGSGSHSRFNPGFFPSYRRFNERFES